MYNRYQNYNELINKNDLNNRTVLISLLGITIAFYNYMKKEYENDESKLKFHKLHHKNLLKLVLFLTLEKYKNNKNIKINNDYAESLIGSYSVVSTIL